MTELRHDWQLEEIQALFSLPFNDLMFKAHQVHLDNFTPNQVQISTLLSIKTGACPEDCSYCSQSARYDTDLERERLLPLDEVLASAQKAKDGGSTRFCMGAAWRNPTDKNLEHVIDMVKGVREMGMETCVTLGMLNKIQADRLKDAGLDYYNHNLDTSPEFYGNVITTRSYQDRLDTLDFVRDAGINVCSGGILGLGETERDRARLLQQLANLKVQPESVPINDLVQIEGTPLAGSEKVAALDFIRTIAVARVMMPKTYVRLSAGRSDMSDETQAWCFFAGANSIFYGDKLLTTDNPEENEDLKLFENLGIQPEQMTETASCSNDSVAA
uniref:Biotin synthase n=1 Tax=uncultured Thiotrichaceae bacterium TaxID=298394 RepID=A0A6S6UIX4_9GAMM|nr:MAG: Biotin synthase (EC [uncultured Thiotrichaceae bacterium]